MKQIDLNRLKAIRARHHPFCELGSCVRFFIESVLLNYDPLDGFIPMACDCDASSAIGDEAEIATISQQWARKNNG